MRSYAMGFGRICGGDFKVEWHWWNGIEENQPGDNVDKGPEETGHQLRAPAIVLKDHDWLQSALDSWLWPDFDC